MLHNFEMQYVEEGAHANSIKVYNNYQEGASLPYNGSIQEVELMPNHGADWRTRNDDDLNGM